MRLLPSTSTANLDSWKLITPQSDVYEKDTKLCVDSPGLRFAIRQKFVEEYWKTRRFLHAFRSASTDFYHIANRKAGGESAHNFASFSYTSLCGAINCTILNWPGSFDGYLPRIAPEEIVEYIG